jgi:drug/metabolite transporter (DMT)-like permease
VILAAVVWAGYALLQKQRLLRLSSPAMLLFIYVVASVVLLPLARCWWWSARPWPACWASGPGAEARATALQRPGIRQQRA